MVSKDLLQELRIIIKEEVEEKPTIASIAESGMCPCPLCSSQDEKKEGTEHD